MPISKIKQASIDASALTGSNITDGTITAADLATDAVTTAKIASNSITTSKIASGAVTNAKIANDSVTSVKINNNSFFTDIWFLDSDRAMAGSSCRLGFNDSTTWVQATESSHSGYGYGTIGTDKMSVSADIFTFPTTGVYRIDYLFNVIADGNDPAIRGDILTSVDGSTFLDTAKQQIYHTAGSQTLGGSCSYHFRVSDTSTHKVKFTLDSATGATIEGGGLGNNAGPMCTYVMFQRLGD